MKQSHSLTALALLMLCFPAGNNAQEDDYGIGYVIPPGGDNMNAVIYSKPDSSSDTIATLSRGSYTFTGQAEPVPAFLVGFRKYDYWGLPILSITPDSNWAEVSVGPSHTYERVSGWVNLRTPGTSIRIWADFLPKQSMVLRRDRPLRFYSKPDTTAIWNIRVPKFPNTDEYSYHLRPIKREGRWLLVELTTPTNPCVDSPKEIQQRFGVLPRSVRVWIQYIDERGRPLVQAPMMC